MTGSGMRTLPANGHNAVLDQFFRSPDYQYTLGRSLDAVNQGGAAGGGLRSGATLRALQREGAGLASQRLDSYLNGLRSLSGGGQVAGSQGVSAGVSTGRGIGNALMAGGNAAASGYENVNNAVTGGLQNILLMRMLEGG